MGDKRFTKNLIERKRESVEEKEGKEWNKKNEKKKEREKKQTKLIELVLNDDDDLVKIVFFFLKS